ncbi:hypothetical protein BdWA1_002916 [Babesia duncani]|uniref:Uncharacterized protein n=1 Tax=Babesia duncani TaxID=323732 RepID=A0AAD9PGV9_9APIC|nr:hypothetical protein BdWA1_003915 [Babesia duncani]KAK2195243.1 hypothetical protein BdWA1_002916 [Babesia duncani]
MIRYCSRNCLKRLKFVVAYRSPQKVDGLVQAVIGNKIGTNNPFCKVTKFNCDGFINKNVSIESAVLALNAMIRNGWILCSFKISRILSYMLSDCNSIKTLDPKLQIDLLNNLCHLQQSREIFKRFNARTNSEMFDTVQELTKHCLNNTIENLTNSGPMPTSTLAGCAGIMAKLNVFNSIFFKQLERALDADGVYLHIGQAFEILDYLEKSFKYRNTPKEKIYNVLDLFQLSFDTLKPSEIVKLVEKLRACDIHHEQLLESCSTWLKESNNIPNITRFILLDVLLYFGYEEDAWDIFTSNDTQPKTLAQYMTALEICAANSHVSGQNIRMYDLLDQMKLVICKMNQKEVIKFISILSRLDTFVIPQYILGPPSMASWVYQRSNTNLATLIESMLDNLQVSQMADIVMLYSIGWSPLYQPKRVPAEIVALISKCIDSMCSTILEQVPMCSKLLDNQLNVQNAGTGVKSNTKLTPTIIDDRDSMVYNTSLMANYKRLKLGDSASSKGSFLKPLPILGNPCTDVKLIDEATISPWELSQHASPVKHGLPSIRHVYKALHVFNLFCGTWNMMPLLVCKKVSEFHKVYKVTMETLNVDYSKMEDRYTLYTFDKNYKKKLEKALKKTDACDIDPRFLSTPSLLHDVKCKFKHKATGPQVLHEDARLRNSNIGIFKPQRLHPRLEGLKPKKPKRLLDAINERRAQKTQRISRIVDQEPSSVDLYESYFRPTFCVLHAQPQENEPKSRFEREIVKTLKAATRLQEQCGPFQVDVILSEL